MAKLSSIFDSLAYANKLKGVGVSEQQATVQAETLFSIIDDQLLTKQDMEEIQKSISSMNYDIKDIETRLSHDMKDIETRLSHDIKDVETRLSEDNKKLDMKLSYEIQATKHEVITKLGSLMAVLLSLFGGSIGALIKLGH